MLTTKFHEKETIQVVDLTTGIWTKAEIVSIASSWSVVIRWPDFPRISNQEIFIPVNQQSLSLSHIWRIRKWTDGNRTRLTRQETIKAQVLDKALPRWREKYETNDEVIFYDAENDRNVKGWVSVNDPFNEQMEVWPANSNEEQEADKNTSPIFIAYENIRASLNEAMDVTPHNSTTHADEDRGEINVPPRKRSRQSTTTDNTPIIKLYLEETLKRTDGKVFINLM